jgi:siroheme synthase-like protein
MTATGHSQSTNRLFPVFLKLENFRVLIVGGGLVGLEKLNAVLRNAPDTPIKMVAIEFHENFRVLAGQYATVELVTKKFEDSDLEGVDFVITALNDRSISQHIYKEAHSRKILINTADTPEFCDFYLGSIVQKGNLKIAISTNGKSPTMAKRLKEWLAITLPNEVDEVLENLSAIREEMRGDMASKIEKLNKLTQAMITDKKKDKN